MKNKTLLSTVTLFLLLQTQSIVAMDLRNYFNPSNLLTNNLNFLKYSPLAIVAVLSISMQNYFASTALKALRKEEKKDREVEMEVTIQSEAALVTLVTEEVTVISNNVSDGRQDLKEYQHLRQIKNKKMKNIFEQNQAAQLDYCKKRTNKIIARLETGEKEREISTQRALHNLFEIQEKEFGEISCKAKLFVEKEDKQHAKLQAEFFETNERAQEQLYNQTEQMQSQLTRIKQAVHRLNNESQKNNAKLQKKERKTKEQHKKQEQLKSICSNFKQQFAHLKQKLESQQSRRQINQQNLYRSNRPQLSREDLKNAIFVVSNN